MPRHGSRNRQLMLLVLVVVLLFLLLGGTFPTWHYAHDWGYGPFGFVGMILVVVLICWALRGRI